MANYLVEGSVDLRVHQRGSQKDQRKAESLGNGWVEKTVAMMAICWVEQLVHLQVQWKVDQ